MSGYQTKQRNMLEDFFARHPEQAFAADEVALHLRQEQGQNAPSRSTVYRLIAELEEDGVIRRFHQEDRKRKSVYRYLDTRECATHLHVQCEQCGALFHVSHEVSDAIVQMLRAGEHVTLDMAGTLLVGCCDACHNRKK